MVLQMARPTKRSGSSKEQFRKRVPADVLRLARGKRITFALPKAHASDERIVVSAKIGTEVMFSLRTEEPSLIKLRHSAAAEQFERAIAAYRQGPSKLLNKQIYGLAGVLCRDINAAFEDEPVSAAWWKIVREVVEDADAGPLWPPLTIDEVADKGARRRLANLERFVGPWVDPILSREGVIPADEDRPALLHAFADALKRAAGKLEENAKGNYDTALEVVRFPKWERIAKTATPKLTARRHGELTLTDLFDRWQRHPDQKTITPSTVASYSGVFSKFRAFMMKRHGSEPVAASLVRNDFRSFIDMRSDEDGVSADTINRGDMAAINAVMNWAVDQELLTTNVAVRVRRKVRKGAESSKRGRKTTNDAEASAILKHALNAPLRGSQEDAKLTAAKRWVPWLMAYTGTRVGELAQLRKCDVGDYEGHAAITITMDAGTVKTKSTWHIPLHPHLIEQGFLDFVKAAPEGHLFLTPRPDLYDPAAKASRTKDPRGILGPLQALKNRLAEFVREAMPNTGSGPAPNHGWRHKFKARGTEFGIAREVLNAFADHAPANSSEIYGKDDLYRSMVAALPMMRRYEV